MTPLMIIKTMRGRLLSKSILRKERASLMQILPAFFL